MEPFGSQAKLPGPAQQALINLLMTAALFSKRRRRIMFLGIAVAFFIVATPAATHAASIVDISGFTLNAFLNIVLGMIATVNSLLGQLFSAAGDGLRFMLSLKITQLTVVGLAWTMIRDMVNMVFIILLIIISFSTIFGTLGFLRNWHARTALMPLIIAAIVMNFSLAIGKTVVLASNEAAKIILNAMDRNPGGALVAAMQPNQLITQLNQNSKVFSTLSGTVTMTSVAGPRTAIEEKRYQACLNEYIDPSQNDSAIYKFLRKISTTIDAGSSAYEAGTLTRKTEFDCKAEMLHARGVSADKAAEKETAAISAGTPQQKLKLIAAGISTAILVVMLTSCLLSAAIFLGLRILMVWVLLVLSPLAWLSYAVPGKEGFKKWWEQFIAWNVFGPLYLLTLIPGLVMLAKSGEVMASFAASGGEIGLANGLVQTFFLYAFAFLIFVGGLALSLKGSFATTIKSSGVIGGLASKLGVFNSYGAAPLKFVSQRTGITPNLQALGEKAKQVGGDVTAGLRGRFPSVVGTKEEALAQAKMRMGVRGGAGEMAQLQAKRIEEQKKIIESRNLDESGLRRLLSSGNRDAKIAAGEILLGKGKLSVDERKTIADEYGKISPVARKEFQKRITEQAVKQAAKTEFATYEELLKTAEASGKSSEDRRKFLEAAMRGEAGNRLKLTGKQLDGLADTMESDEDKRAFFESVTKSGRNKVAAIESMATRGMIVNRNGTKMKVDEALADRADSLSPDDLLDAEEYYHNSGNTMSDVVAQKYRQALADRDKSARMLRNASDPDQHARLYGGIITEAGIVQEKQVQIESGDKLLRGYDKILKKARRSAEKTKEESARSDMEKFIEETEVRRDKLKKELSQLRKSV
jgi:hypothetical protein